MLMRRPYGRRRMVDGVRAQYLLLVIFGRAFEHGVAGAFYAEGAMMIPLSAAGLLLFAGLKHLESRIVQYAYQGLIILLICSFCLNYLLTLLLPLLASRMHIWTLLLPLLLRIFQ